MAKRDASILPVPMSEQELEDKSSMEQATVSGYGSGVLKHEGTDHLTVYYVLENLDYPDRPRMLVAIIDSIVDEQGRDWMGHPDLDLDWVESQEDRLCMSAEDVEAEAVDAAYEAWREREVA